MRPASSTYAAAVRRGGTSTVTVTAWLGDQYLAEVPVVLGSWEVTDAEDDATPGTIRFQVPNTPEWRPTAPDHPLGWYGQTVQLRAGYGAETLPLGVYRLDRPTITDETIDVTGRGLMCRVEDARFLEPWKATGLTRAGAVRRLLAGILPVAFVGVVDEALPEVVEDRERLDALQAVLEGWPARVHVDDSGVAVITPPFDDLRPGAPLLDFVDGPAGTIESVDPSADGADEGVFNGYSVSTQPDATTAQMTESWVMLDGPMRWGGPYGYRPGFFSSGFLTASRARLRTIAETMTRRAVRRQDAVSFQAAPDYRAQIGDVVRVRDSRVGVDMVGRLTRITHRRTATAGTVSYLSGVR